MMTTSFRLSLQRTLRALLIGLPCAYFSVASGVDYIPFVVTGMNPFSISHDPLQAPSWQTREVNSYSVDLRVEAANFSIQNTAGGEKIILDGETYKTTLSLHYPFSEQLTGQLSIPYIHYSSGFMDHAIEQWHDAFGLSNARRNVFNRNQLQVEYIENGVPVIRLLNATAGLGDSRLGLSYALTPDSRTDLALALKLELKLPSGDPDQLTGNGATDWGISLHALQQPLGQLENLALFGGFGLSVLGQGEILPSRQRDHSLSAYAGVHWLALPRLQLTTQLQLQSARYDSELDELGKTSTLLLIGGRYQASAGHYYQFAFGENLYTDASADFSLYFSMHTE